MRNREIAVAFYDLLIKSNTRVRAIESPACADISDVIRALASMVREKQKPVIEQRGRTTLIEVMDFEFDSKKNEIHILVNRADRDLPDVAFKDFKTRETRFAGKKKEEGIDISTHLVLRPSADGRSAVLLVTQGGGMSIGILEAFFGKWTRLLKDEGKHLKLFEFPHPSGEKDKSYQVTYSFECHGHKGATLENDLALGKLTEMELISHRSARFDSGGNLMMSATSISLKPIATFAGTLTNIKAAIRDGMSQSKESYDEVRIKFKDHSDKLRSESFLINALDEAFVRREYIHFDTDIQSNYKKISKQIHDQMSGLQ